MFTMRDECAKAWVWVVGVPQCAVWATGQDPRCCGALEVLASVDRVARDTGGDHGVHAAFTD